MLVFALTVLPAILFLGLVTYVRVLQSSIEDVLYARAINRIRHYYTELDPARAHRFTRMKATVEALFPTGADGW